MSQPQDPFESVTFHVTWHLAALALAACSASVPSGEPSASDRAGGPATASEPLAATDAEIERAAADYASLTKVNAASFHAAEHQGHPLVDVYANDLARGPYLSVDPMQTAPSGFAFPVGAMLVKEMRQPGEPTLLTVMRKQPPGFDPDHGDWWYGRLATDGTPTNAAYVGTVDFCVSCHGAAAPWGYARGLPADAR